MSKTKTIKPSHRIKALTSEGNTVLRAQIRYAGKHPYQIAFWVIAEHNGTGWQTWAQSMHYKTRKHAEEAIARACERNPLLIDESKLTQI